jgi:hypothetical protein
VLGRPGGRDGGSTGEESRRDGGDRVTTNDPIAEVVSAATYLPRHHARRSR